MSAEREIPNLDECRTAWFFGELTANIHWEMVGAALGLEEIDWDGFFQQLGAQFLARPDSWETEQKLKAALDELRKEINGILENTDDLDEDFEDYDGLYQKIIDKVQSPASDEVTPRGWSYERFEEAVTEIFRKRQTRITQAKDRFRNEFKEQLCGEDSLLTSLFALGELLGQLRFPEMYWGKRIQPIGKTIDFPFPPDPAEDQSDSGMLRFVPSSIGDIVHSISPRSTPTHDQLRSVIHQLRTLFSNDPDLPQHLNEIASLGQKSGGYIQSDEKTTAEQVIDAVHDALNILIPVEIERRGVNEPGEGESDEDKIPTRNDLDYLGLSYEQDGERVHVFRDGYEQSVELSPQLGAFFIAIAEGKERGISRDNLQTYLSGQQQHSSGIKGAIATSISKLRKRLGPIHLAIPDTSRGAEFYRLISVDESDA